VKKDCANVLFFRYIFFIPLRMTSEGAAKNLQRTAGFWA
jgi:hypothetical protein